MIKFLKSIFKDTNFRLIFLSFLNNEGKMAANGRERESNWKTKMKILFKMA